jgi:hypothetical protein
MNQFEIPPVGNFAPIRRPYSSPPMTEWAHALPATSSFPAQNSQAVLPPFWIVATDVDKVMLIPGLVNNLNPTLGGDPLTWEPPPETSALGNGTWSIYLAVTTDSEGIATGVTVNNTTSALPTDTATLGHVQLGWVRVVDNEIERIVQQRWGSLWHQRCGETLHLFGSAG